MSSYYSYSDDDDIEIRDRRRHRSPPVHYVGAPAPEFRQRPRSYYAADAGYLDGGAAVLPARAVSRDRFRGRRASSPPAAAQAPVVINNRIYHEHSSDDDDRHHHLQLARHHRSRSTSRSSPHVLTREEFEMDRTRRELAQLKLARDMDERERRHARELEEEAVLRAAQEELKGIKQVQAREEAEKQIKKELEFKRLKEEERETEQKEKREREAEAAVERYKQEELERIHKEKVVLERQEREYQRRMQEHLFQSGLDDDAVEAIMRKKKVPESKSDRPGGHTHTRMARRHLSFETLRTFDIDYALDEDPEFVLIKRWVPEWEQDALWKHTRLVREKRSKLILNVDDKKHRHRHHHHPDLRRDDNFEWVRKRSSSRKRSKSPGLLMYLAGGRPA